MAEQKTAFDTYKLTKPQLDRFDMVPDQFLDPTTAPPPETQIPFHPQTAMSRKDGCWTITSWKCKSLNLNVWFLPETKVVISDPVTHKVVLVSDDAGKLSCPYCEEVSEDSDVSIDETPFDSGMRRMPIPYTPPELAESELSAGLEAMGVDW